MKFVRFNVSAQAASCSCSRFQSPPIMTEFVASDVQLETNLAKVLRSFEGTSIFVPSGSFPIKKR